MGAPPTPPRKINSADLFDALEVTLEGYEYTLRTITRTVSERLYQEQQKAQEFDESAPPSEVAPALIEIIDVLLEPKGDAPGAGDVLREKWDADTLGLDWLTAFAQTIQEETQARRRPTSASRTRT